MKVISLQSGSSGNSFFVETSEYRLLFDAGISFRSARERLACHDREISAVDAIFITHDHGDHIRCLNAFHNKLQVPVYMTHRTFSAARNAGKISDLKHKRFFNAGESVSLQRNGRGVVIHSIPTPHDSADGVAFVVEDDEGQRIGILTDLGHVFDGLREVLKSLDAVVIESNYDDEMLEFGQYPWRLKQRIRGRGGHLSNVEAAELISEFGSQRLKWACLCHLSKDNNCPEVARRTHQQILGDDFQIHVASRDQVSGVFEI